MKITRRQLRRIIRESMSIPGWVESHFAWRKVAFTRNGEVRYINDVASPETARAVIDIGEKPIPPGTNVLVVFGAYPNTKSKWMHDSELLDLIKREGWHERPAPEGANPEGFWDGKGEWQEPEEHGLPDFDLPDLPPATEGKMRIKKSQLRKMIREALDTHNMDSNKAYELIAILQEFGYELFLPPATDSNNIAINDALAGYPGEFTYDDLMTAVRIVQGRGA